MNIEKDSPVQISDTQEVLKKGKELAELIRNSEVSCRYQKCLKVLKGDENIYEKLKEFRQKNLLIEMEQGEDYYHKASALYAEYNDLLLERAVSEFLTAEQQMNRMLKTIYDQLSEAAQLDLSYFEQ